MQESHTPKFELHYTPKLYTKSHSKAEPMDTAFNTGTELRKYELTETTFDEINIDSFHNTKFGTVCSYLWEWVLMFLGWALLGSDMYTCINILVFNRWSTNDLKPFAYLVAKWIFTGCIIFQYVLLIYHLVWGIYIVRTNNIALAYLNPTAKLFKTLRSYNYHCFFTQIQHDKRLDWCCFFCYNELWNALQILGADTPRQVVNILTLQHYALDYTDANIITNIRLIATSNLQLSIVLSFMLLSVVIWSIFFFKFCFGILLYPYVKVNTRKKGFLSIKRYNCKVINSNIKYMVAKNNTKLRNKRDEMILKQKLKSSFRTDTNPFLDISRVDSDYTLYSQQKPENPFGDGFYKHDASSLSSLSYDRKTYDKNGRNSVYEKKVANVGSRLVTNSSALLVAGSSIQPLRYAPTMPLLDEFTQRTSSMGQDRTALLGDTRYAHHGYRQQGEAHGKQRRELFGNYLLSNTHGNSLVSNAHGYSLLTNTLGTSLRTNTLGASLLSNTLGTSLLTLQHPNTNLFTRPLTNPALNPTADPNSSRMHRKAPENIAPSESQIPQYDNSQYAETHELQDYPQRPQFGSYNSGHSSHYDYNDVDLGSRNNSNSLENPFLDSQHKFGDFPPDGRYSPSIEFSGPAHEDEETVAPLRTVHENGSSQALLDANTPYPVRGVSLYDLKYSYKGSND